MVLPSRPPPEDGPLPLSPTPPKIPFPSPKPTAAAASQSPNGGKQIRKGRRRLPAGRLSAARRSGQEGGSTRHPLRRRQHEVRGQRPGPGARRRQRRPGVGNGATGVEGVGSAAELGDGVVPAADGIRTREVGREMSPHRASLARSRRRHQRRRRHLHFCPSFSVSQAPLPSGGGGANGGRRRRRREETGGRGHGSEGAGLRETGGKAFSIGRLNVVGPRRCKARVDWSIRPPSPAPSGAGTSPE